MATQHCPRCKSDRIRHGYRPTSFFQKIIFRYNLLCDNCNWEFIGFAIPGTVPIKSKRRNKLAGSNSSAGSEKESKITSVNGHEEIPAQQKPDDTDIKASLNSEVVNPDNSEAVISEKHIAEQDLSVSEQEKKKKGKVKKRVRVKLS